MKLLELLKKREQELREKIKASNDAAEIRSMGDELNATMEEIRALEEKLKDQQQRDQQGEPDPQQRTATPDIPDNVQLRNGFVASFNQTPTNRNEDPTDTIEYRTAFMNYVCRNVPIPAELRENQVTTTTDASAVIPKTILNEIVTFILDWLSGYPFLFSASGHFRCGIFNQPHCKVTQFSPNPRIYPPENRKQ